jgi:hypothetical protein
LGPFEVKTLLIRDGAPPEMVETDIPELQSSR